MTKRFGSLRAVALIEVTKGVLALVAAGLIAGVLHSDLQSMAETLVRHFHMNPARHHPRVFLETLRDLADAHRLVLSLGAICYAAVRFVEAYGLWRARRWAWGDSNRAVISLSRSAIRRFAGRNYPLSVDQLPHLAHVARWLVFDRTSTDSQVVPPPSPQRQRSTPS